MADARVQVDTALTAAGETGATIRGALPCRANLGCSAYRPTGSTVTGIGRGIRAGSRAECQARLALARAAGTELAGGALNATAAAIGRITGRVHTGSATGVVSRRAQARSAHAPLGRPAGVGTSAAVLRIRGRAHAFTSAIAVACRAGADSRYAPLRCPALVATAAAVAGIGRNVDALTAAAFLSRGATAAPVAASAPRRTLDIAGSAVTRVGSDVDTHITTELFALGTLRRRRSGRTTHSVRSGIAAPPGRDRQTREHNQANHPALRHNLLVFLHWPGRRRRAEPAGSAHSTSPGRRRLASSLSRRRCRRSSPPRLPVPESTFLHSPDLLPTRGSR